MRKGFSFIKFAIGKTIKDNQKRFERGEMFNKHDKISTTLAFCSMIAVFAGIVIKNDIISGVITVIALVCFVIATIVDCFNYGPVTRWRHATLKSGVAALVWLGLPIFLFLAGDESKEDMLPIAYSSAIMWTAFFVSLFMWIKRRRQAKAAAAVIDMRIRTRRKIR